MDRAIVGVCPDARQRKILSVTLPSWRAYAKKHGLSIHIIERNYAAPHFYWSKHLLYQAPELKPYQYLLFLDNDVFINQHAGPLLNDWDSPLIGATSESSQFGWSGEYIDRYYESYLVDRSISISEPCVLNTGVLVIPREQAAFLESTYGSWKERRLQLPATGHSAKAAFLAEADQPHVSYALQANSRFRQFDESYNLLWWNWYRNNVRAERRPFRRRAKAAALTMNWLPGKLWRTCFRRERETFATARSQCDFLHVAGSKSAVFLGAEALAKAKE